MKNYALNAFYLFLIAGCLSSPSSKLASTGDETQRIPTRQIASSASELPEISISDPALIQTVSDEISKVAKRTKQKLTSEQIQNLAERVARYLSFLDIKKNEIEKDSGVDTPITSPDEPAQPPAQVKADPVDAESSSDVSKAKILTRLLTSSLQFLMCTDLRDWNCLESNPPMIESQLYRRDPKANLGQAIRAGAKFDAEVFFTHAWTNLSQPADTSKTLVNRLAERINRDASKSLSMALYGIDDINGSIKPVYDAILGKKAANIPVRGVFDVSAFEQTSTPWNFDYSLPLPLQAQPGEKKGFRPLFQYDGTAQLINELNTSLPRNREPSARLEFPQGPIMHDKFFVMEGEHYSVWTGTANVSAHCMGVEQNSNMAIYIKNNDVIGKAFLDEFNLMFNFGPDLKAKSRFLNGTANSSFGRFHHNKYPVSNRLFTFDDGTKVRVHFAPTDDAEHRVVIPMLLSAKQGDHIRVSMFGNSGYEYIRAFQYAVAAGAKVEVFLDRQQAAGLYSWIRDSRNNLLSKNPYIEKFPTSMGGSLQVRTSTWEGKNHYKASTLTKKDGRVEEFIVGSQNWSSGGNDANDENMISIQNLTDTISQGAAFNDEFDQELWPMGRPARGSSSK